MNALTNSTKKIYASLSTPKGRKEHGLFMAQGTKCVLDTIDFFEVEAIVASPQWIESHKALQDLYEILPAKPADLQKITTLSSVPEVIAIYKIPESRKPQLKDNLVLALDGLQDPGNLGTIIRVADWMGITDIFASNDTVDVWNPKVVQATMGAISRVSIYYTDLAAELKKHRNQPIYGTTLDGNDIYTAKLSNEGIIVMGNEGNGIRPDIRELINQKLFIPPYPTGRMTSESLNVAVATAITLSEFRRREQRN